MATRDDASQPVRREITRHLETARHAMMGFAMKLTRDPAAAEDLVQSTAERALLNAAWYRQGTDVSAWTNRIMYRLFIDACRCARRRAERALPAEVVAASDGGEDRPPCAWEWITMGDVQSALLRLTPAQRAAFELCALAGMSYEEAAMRLGIPLRTVGTRLVRARARLRALLLANVRAGALVTPLVFTVAPANEGAELTPRTVAA